MVWLILLSTSPSSGIRLISALPGSLGYKAAQYNYMVFGGTIVLRQLICAFSKHIHNTKVMPWYINLCVKILRYHRFKVSWLIKFIFTTYKIPNCEAFCIVFDQLYGLENLRMDRQDAYILTLPWFPIPCYACPNPTSRFSPLPFSVSNPNMASKLVSTGKSTLCTVAVIEWRSYAVYTAANTALYHSFLERQYQSNVLTFLQTAAMI